MKVVYTMNLTKKVRFVFLFYFIVLLTFFSNQALAKMNSNEINKTNEIQSDKFDYLIITIKTFVDEVEPLAEWKTQKGLVAKIVFVEDIEQDYTGVDTAEKIRNCIKDYYSNYCTKWVVLAGGDNYIPSRLVSVDNVQVYSDYYYSNLDNNWIISAGGVASIVNLLDWEADVYVGRLPAERSSQLEDLVTRILNYEKNPPIGSWMKNALFAGTYANFDMDLNDNDILDNDEPFAFDTNRNHNWLKENILPSDWTSVMLAETDGEVITSYPYNSSISTSNFITEVNSGAAIVMADAHGSPYGMSRTIFTNDVDGDNLFDDVDSLNSISFLSKASKFETNGMNGFYWLAACSTGTFTEGDCLSEYIVRNSGIGCIASYESSYYDPSEYNSTFHGWYTQGLSTRFWEQLFIHGIDQPGKAYSLAKIDYIADHIAADGPDTNGRTLTQYNLMGDPEVNLWTDIPLAIGAEINFNETTRIVSIKALVDDQPLANVTITITCSSYFNNITTDEFGEANLLLPDFVDADEIIITLTKNHFIPYQEYLTSTKKLSISLFNIPFAFTLIISVAILRFARKKRKNDISI
ncbi:MAG: hypothetical protein EAX90_10525 [Candidatus Heimdallarchaeota archaeon]|nr:hypothetical protein [Candidatus Heimdallarchaeota archaeon]